MGNLEEVTQRLGWPEGGGYPDLTPAEQELRESLLALRDQGDPRLAYGKHQVTLMNLNLRANPEHNAKVRELMEVWDRR
jgi:hypothetical protein